MKPEDLRDLRNGILIELYRLGGDRGRSARALHTILKQQVACEVSDVQAQLTFLKGLGYVKDVAADDIAPGLDPFWIITSAGMAHAEAAHIV